MKAAAQAVGAITERRGLANVMNFPAAQTDVVAAAHDKRTFIAGHGTFGREAEVKGRRALLVDDSHGSGESIRTLVAGMGYAIVDNDGRPGPLRHEIEAARPDLIVIRTATPSAALIEQLRALPADRACPVVMFSEDGSPASINSAVEAGVNSYVVVGATGNRVRSAVELAYANFQAARGLRAERDEALAALRDRKIVERAKGLVMKEKGMDEAGAYALLRKRAMQKGIRLVDVATMINEAAEMLND